MRFRSKGSCVRVASGNRFSIIAPEPPETYRTWRAQATADAVANLGLPAGKRTKSQEKRIPRRWSHHSRPTSWRLSDGTPHGGRPTGSQPPGSRRVVYWRRGDALRVTEPVRARQSSVAPVEAMLLALTTPSGSASALPSTVRTLPQADLIHRALVARVGYGRPIDCPELTGRDERGRPLTGHRHAHILPVDLDGDGHLDHVVVYAPMLLRHDAQKAIRALRRTWTKGASASSNSPSPAAARSKTCAPYLPRSTAVFDQFWAFFWRTLLGQRHHFRTATSSQATWSQYCGGSGQ